MAKKSPHFFTYGNHPIGKLPEYLEQMLKKMVKDSTVSVNSSFASSISATNGSNKGNKTFFFIPLIVLRSNLFSDSSEKGNDTNSGPQVCSPEVLNEIADRLAENWTKLLPKLGLNSEAEEEIKKEEDDKGKRISFQYLIYQVGPWM